jgi:hypothetical protein
LDRLQTEAKSFFVIPRNDRSEQCHASAEDLVQSHPTKNRLLHKAGFAKGNSQEPLHSIGKDKAHEDRKRHPAEHQNTTITHFSLLPFEVVEARGRRE